MSKFYNEEFCCPNLRCTSEAWQKHVFKASKFYHEYFMSQSTFIRYLNFPYCTTPSHRVCLIKIVACQLQINMFSSDTNVTQKHWLTYFQLNWLPTINRAEINTFYYFQRNNYINPNIEI